MWSFKKNIYRIEDYIPETPGIYQYLVNLSESNGSATSSCGGSVTYPIWTNEASLGAIGVSSVLYSDSGLITPWIGQSEWYGINTAYGSTPSKSLQISNLGVVITTDTCTVTPPSFYTKFISSSTPEFPCGSPSIPTTYPFEVFTAVQYPQINDYFYVSSDLSVGYPGDGTYYWTSLAFGYQIDGTGKVTGIVDCS